MGKSIDLTGKKFGLWLVLGRSDDYVDKKGNHYPRWLCECQCKKKTRRLYRSHELTSGYTTNCGCVEKFNPNSADLS